MAGRAVKFDNGTSRELKIISPRNRSLGRRPPNGIVARVYIYTHTLCIGIYNTTPAVYLLYIKRRSTQINHRGTGRQIKTAGNCI